MNFTTNIVPADSWGSVDENGTWNGIIDSLQQNLTQVGIVSSFTQKVKILWQLSLLLFPKA